MKQNWEIKKLGDVCEFFNGQAHENAINEEGKYILVNSKFVSSDGKKFKRTNKVLFPLYKGDIVMVMSDVPDGKTLAKCFLIEKDNTYTLNQRICVIRTKQFDSRFLLRHLNRHPYLLKFNNGENQTNLRKDDILNCPLLIPPLSEQKHIVAKLDDTFGAIDKAKINAEQNLKKSKELFESYLNEIFESKAKQCGEKKLGDVCELISKGSSPKWQGIKYVDKPGVLFVTSENVGENKLIIDEKKYVEEKFNLKDKKSILKKGDVLTNIVGASIGRTAIFALDEIANINQAVCLIRCNQNILYNEYLMYLLNSPFTKQHLHDNEVNSARANLSLSFFRNLSIPLPQISEQKLIVEEVKRFHKETQGLESVYKNKINFSEELKKSILQKVFSGELKTKHVKEFA